MVQPCCTPLCVLAQHVLVLQFDSKQVQARLFALKACHCVGAQGKVQPPELKRFMDKKLSGEACLGGAQVRLLAANSPDVTVCPIHAVALNANRHVSGTLRGFDQFMNIVLDNAVDEKNKTDIGMVVSCMHSLACAGTLAVHWVR